ncbi:MAG: hypothetical protein ACI4J4_09170, partial [Ruminiclostridium sp.]
MSKVKGNRTLDTAGGKTLAELAEMNGVDPAFLAMNATVTDNTFTITSATVSFSYSIQVKSNGFECYDADKNLVMGVTYDSAKDTLSFQTAGVDGNHVDNVMKKGTAVISPSP